MLCCKCGIPSGPRNTLYNSGGVGVVGAVSPGVNHSPDGYATGTPTPLLTTVSTAGPTGSCHGSDLLELHGSGKVEESPGEETSEEDKEIELIDTIKR